MKVREGDLIEDNAGLIFDVKGLVHPPGKAVAFPRFIPDFPGSRLYKGQTYKKIYSLSARFKYLEQNFPGYLVQDPVFDETVCEIPMNAVKTHYKPVEKLRKLRKSETLKDLERKVLQLTEMLREVASIRWNTVGISGSLLVGLHTAKSDLDPIVYGAENCWRVHSALKGMLQDETSHFKPYARKDLRVLFDFRSKDTVMSLEDFVKVEMRKVFQGKFMGTDYFIRFVKNWSQVNEKYGDVRYKNCGYARIKATIADDSESIFTPCKYDVENVTVIEGSKLQPILEIASFRGRFCEQARKGEEVIAQGKVERVVDNKEGREHFRILLGNKPSDYMALTRV